MNALRIGDIGVIGAVRVLCPWRTTPGSKSARTVVAVWALALFVVAGCASSQPVRPNTLEESPLAFIDQAGTKTADHRGRFREILCAVNEKSGRGFPGYRSCEEILNRFGDEPAGPGTPVDLGPPQRKLHIAAVGGLGAECFAQFIQPFHFALQHLQSLGHEASHLRVDGLSSSAENGRVIRDAVLEMDLDPTDKRLVLVGYSKGAPDIIEGVVAHPELQQRVAAVVTIAGAVSGSPLSYDSPEWIVSLAEHIPGAECEAGDGGAVESLEPGVRRQFAATHELPAGIGYYSLGSFAPREQISTMLLGQYDQLAKIDERNDGQMIFDDQVIAGGALLGFLKSDHWAAGMPMSRLYPTLSSVFVDQNEFPREIVLEAVVRHVEEQLRTSQEGALAE